jgi:hypothetical protein
MLVSGAVLYSLFQLPAVIDAGMRRWEPHTTYAAGIALLMVYAYLKGAVYTLVAAFVVHLAARTYWVGLVGLNSVFGGGVRWERTQFGPITQRLYREMMPPLPRVIARIDNFASVIFSFAFLVVLVALISLPLLGAVGGAAYGISALLFGGGSLRWVMAATLLVLTVPSIAAAYLDRAYGARLDPDGRPARALRRALRVFYHTQLVGLLGPTLFTISTNGRRRTTYALFYVVLIGSVYLALTEWLARRGAFGLNGADFFTARADASAVDYDHYESEWPAGFVNDDEPSIPADVVRDSHVRLFIPYQPVRHNPAVAARCPDVRPIEPRGARFQLPGRAAPPDARNADAALRCIAAIHAVTLDGAAQPGLRFRFASHPRTGVNGVVAYLPVADLARGEHVLTVTPPPRRPGSRIATPVEPAVIPFWR